MKFVYSIDVGRSVGRNAISKGAIESAIRRITRPTIEEFASWCRPKFCGSGTELVEPFLIERYDADAGVVTLSVSYIGTMEWATSTEKEQAAATIGSIVQRRLSDSGLFPGGVSVLYTGGSSETYWPDVDRFTGFVLDKVEPAIKATGNAIVTTVAGTFSFLRSNWKIVLVAIAAIAVIGWLND